MTQEDHMAKFEGHIICAWCGDMMNEVMHKPVRIGRKFYHEACNEERIREKRNKIRRKRAKGN